MSAGASERLLDRLSEHEMGCEQPHRLPRGRAHGGNAESFDQAFQNGVRGLAGMDDAGGHAEGPGGGRHQERARFDVVR